MFPISSIPLEIVSTLRLYSNMMEISDSMKKLICNSMDLLHSPSQLILWICVTTEFMILIKKRGLCLHVYDTYSQNSVADDVKLT